MFYLNKRNTRFIIGFVLISFFGINACQTPQSSQPENAKNDVLNSSTSSKASIDSEAENTAFFNLKSYIEKEVGNLQTSKVQLNKTVKVGDKSETKTIENPDWKNELQVFSDSDINKTAWTDKYDINEGAKSLTYIANDSSMKTKRIQVDFWDDSQSMDKIKSIIIINNTQNVLYNSSEFLTYTPNSNITIIRTQQVATGEMKNVEIRGEIIK